MNSLEKVKKYGIRAALRYICERVFRTQIVKAHYLRLVIDIDKVNELLKNFNLPVVELTYEDFKKGNPNVFKGAKMELYKERCQDETYKAYGIFDGERLVYSTWISYHRLGMSYGKQKIYLSPNEGYLEDSYCDPIARGRGFHGAMNNYRIKKIFESGRDTVIAIVQDGNIPALKVQAKSGLKEVGCFYHGYIFGKQFNTLKKNKMDRK